MEYFNSFIAYQMFFVELNSCFFFYVILCIYVSAKIKPEKIRKQDEQKIIQLWELG